MSTYAIMMLVAYSKESSSFRRRGLQPASKYGSWLAREHTTRRGNRRPKGMLIWNHSRKKRTTHPVRIEDFALVHGLNSLLDQNSTLFQRFKQHPKVRYDEKTDLWSYKVCIPICFSYKCVGMSRTSLTVASLTTKCTQRATLSHFSAKSTTIRLLLRLNLQLRACVWLNCANPIHQHERPLKSLRMKSLLKNGRSLFLEANAMDLSSTCFGIPSKVILLSPLTMNLRNYGTASTFRMLSISRQTLRMKVFQQPS